MPSDSLLQILALVAVAGIPVAVLYLILGYLRRIAEATERLANMRDR